MVVQTANIEKIPFGKDDTVNLWVLHTEYNTREYMGLFTDRQQAWRFIVDVYPYCDITTSYVHEFTSK
jgi:hypothetical protein